MVVEAHRDALSASVRRDVSLFFFLPLGMMSKPMDRAMLRVQMLIFWALASISYSENQVQTGDRKSVV